MNRDRHLKKEGDRTWLSHLRLQPIPLLTSRCNLPMRMPHAGLAQVQLKGMAFGKLKIPLIPSSPIFLHHSQVVGFQFSTLSCVSRSQVCPLRSSRSFKKLGSSGCANPQQVSKACEKLHTAGQRKGFRVVTGLSALTPLSPLSSLPHLSILPLLLLASSTLFLTHSLIITPIRHFTTRQSHPTFGSQAPGYILYFFSHLTLLPERDSRGDILLIVRAQFLRRHPDAVQSQCFSIPRPDRYDSGNRDSPSARHFPAESSSPPFLTPRSVLTLPHHPPRPPSPPRSPHPAHNTPSQHTLTSPRSLRAISPIPRRNVARGPRQRGPHLSVRSRA